MGEQLALVAVPRTRRRRAGRAPAADVPLADELPVARVLVDTPLAHLDRPFEYAVPATLAADARTGVRVKVRLAGRDHDGFLLERTATAEHTGRLTPLRSVVSPEPVLSPSVAQEARSVADHYGGTVADVLRLAVPPRHARAERSVPEVEPSSTWRRTGTAATSADADGTGEGDAPWADYPAGAAFLHRLRAGEAPAASWLALPSRPDGTDWPDALARAVLATRAGGRGSIVVLPDHRDVDRVLQRLSQDLDEHDVARLTADQGPEARYRAFLRVLRGHAGIVVGTRSAAFAPVPDLGLLVCWDEADDLHQEARAPYPHVREVLRIRARHERAGLVLGGFTRSVAVQGWVDDGRLAPVAAQPATVRAAAPGVVVAGEGRQPDRDAAARSARIPSLAWRALKAGLQHGAVLVQVPRQGYVVGLACQDCRTPVRCPRCSGPVGAPAAGEAPRCRWCAQELPQQHGCASCGSTRRRATGVGERRTAEELGRAFPGTVVISSGGAHVVPEVRPEPALVVATPGAEPRCPGGYAVVALLDGWRLLERASVDAPAEALRRWVGAAALTTCRPAAEGQRATVVLCGVPPHAQLPAVEALVRWDPARLARRDLVERRELRLPPTRRHASLTGPAAAVAEACEMLAGEGHEVLGTGHGADPGGGHPETVAVVGERSGAARGLAASCQAVRSARSARKAPQSVRIVLDAIDLTA